MARHHVDVAGDFLDRLRAGPGRALAELVWNSLDADATVVEVTVDRNELGGIQAVEVKDNGTGMTNEQAVIAFGALGGSWKWIERQNKTLKRELHGSAGRGRFLAFGIGGAQIRWRTVAEAAGVRQVTTIDVASADRDFFEVSEPEGTDEPIGTVVEWTASPMCRTAWSELLTEFALYIERYQPDILVDKRRLDVCRERPACHRPEDRGAPLQDREPGDRDEEDRRRSAEETSGDHSFDSSRIHRGRHEQQRPEDKPEDRNVGEGGSVERGAEREESVEVCQRGKRPERRQASRDRAAGRRGQADGKDWQHDRQAEDLVSLCQPDQCVAIAIEAGHGQASH